MGRNNRHSKDTWVDMVIREKKEWIAQLEKIQRLFPDDDREYIYWQIKTTQENLSEFCVSRGQVLNRAFQFCSRFCLSIAQPPEVL